MVKGFVNIDVVSIHAPARGRPGFCLSGGKYIKFQFTPPRGGDKIMEDEAKRESVSIHAPARGRPAREPTTGRR